MHSIVSGSCSFLLSVLLPAVFFYFGPGVEQKKEKENKRLRREEPIGALSLSLVLCRSATSFSFDWADRQRTKETARQKVTTGMRFHFLSFLCLLIGR
jgi:hypothetical protein